MIHTTRRLAVIALACASTVAFAQSKEIRIAHVYSKTGPLEAYAKQTHVGLMMGLDYATGGTMTVAGKKLVIIEKDDQGKPDLGKSLLAAAYGDDKADIAVGPTASPVALAMLPVAEEYRKVLLVEPAVADSITGDKWNKYIFRTGRNS
jgi:branched-chain amino acid transport system substrate-binding protein